MGEPTEFVLVPREPTDAMIRAMENEIVSWIAPGMHGADVYRAALRRAQPPQPTGDNKELVEQLRRSADRGYLTPDAAREAADALERADSRLAAQDEIGWLIEPNEQWAQPVFLSLDLKVPGFWTEDHALATRFGRKVDAENWLTSQDNIDPAKVHPVEHLWSNAP